MTTTPTFAYTLGPEGRYERDELLVQRAYLTSGELRGEGPFTKEQAESVAAYERYCEESLREYELEQAAGGRTVCPKCGQRTLKDRTVCTYGYPGHPGADYSALYECENPACDYHELA